MGDQLKKKDDLRRDVSSFEKIHIRRADINILNSRIKF